MTPCSSNTKALSVIVLKLVVRAVGLDAVGGFGTGADGGFGLFLALEDC